MKEQIYTIPINEQFDKALASDTPVCPVCGLFDMLEKNEIERVLGPAMMEPDVRIETNKAGFCRHHYEQMFGAKNRLGLALILESHIASVEKSVLTGKTLLDGSGDGERGKVNKLSDSCYICSRIDDAIFKMVKNIIFLWETEEDFREKFKSQRCFCLPHYSVIAEHAKAELSKKDFGLFYDTISKTEKAYIKELGEDVSWFCKKFDYRYENEPWYNAKDSVARAISFLSPEHKTKSVPEKKQ